MRYRASDLSTLLVSLAAGACALQIQKQSSQQSMTARPLLVSDRQKGNPLLKHLKNVPWKHDATITPDYVLGDRNCAVFISIRYHMLKPQYLGR